MPLKALDKQTNQPVYSFLYDSKLELIANHPSLICPFSGIDCFARSRGGYVLHFVRKYQPERDEYDSHPESIPHLMAKEHIYREFIRMREKNSDRYKGFQIELEYPITLGQQKRKRIADVMIIAPDGSPITAIEVQLATITEQELEERTNDYEKLGIDCIWYFGDKNNKSHIRSWSVDKSGTFRTIKFNYRESTQSFQDALAHYC